MVFTELIRMTLTVNQQFFWTYFMPNFNQVGHKMCKMGQSILYDPK